MRLFAWEIRKLAGDSAARTGLVTFAAVMLVALFGAILAPEPELAGFASGAARIDPGKLPPHIARELAARARAAGVAPPTGEAAGAPGAGETAGAVGAATKIRLKNGWNFASRLLRQATVLSALVVCLVVAGLVAGEAERGTLEVALARPAPRWAMILAKLGAGAVYGLALMGAAAFVGLVLGRITLGAGPLVPIMPAVGRAASRAAGGPGGAAGKTLEIVNLTGAAAAFRVAFAYLVAALGLAPVAALALLVSASCSSARTAAVVSASAYFGLTALAATPGLESVRPYLVVTQVAVMWEAVLAPSVEWGRMLRCLPVLVVALSLFTGGAVFILSGRELPPRA